MSRRRDHHTQHDDEELGKRIKREIDAYNSSSQQQQLQMGMRRSRSSQMLGGSGLNTITPCAACKLLRRRCAEECPFSPYFSPHDPLKFVAVHKVFGASNVSKMLLDVPEIQRADAANSLVYEANVRLRDPIYGCMGAILALQQQIQSLQSELNSVRSEILRHKYREAANSDLIASTLISASATSIAASATPSPPPPPSIVISSSCNSTSSSSSSISNSIHLYSLPSTSSGYSTTISNNNVSYFA